jgi:salicylate hydroxylase
LKIVVIGAGIGGLTTALALAQSGHAVEVVEKASSLSPLGAGLQVSANARRVLHNLGIGKAFSSICTEPSRIVVRRWEDDSIIGEGALAGLHDAQFGFAFANVARNDLARILHDAATSDEYISVRFDAGVVSVEQNGAHPTVSVNGVEMEADVVIAADGIHSVVRPLLAGTETPRCSGWSAFRAQVPRDRVPHLPVETTNRVGPGAHVVSYFIGENQSHLNLVFIAPEPEWPGESWTERTSVESLREAFVGWSSELQEIIDAVEEPVYRWALYDREPLMKWCNGSVALLGDAAHPMLPFMAQGACQAIEDAAVLARCLDGVSADSTTIETALHLYETTRVERANQIQSGSYFNRIVFHFPDGEEQRQRDEMFATGGWATATDWVYSYDALTAPLG